MNNKIVRTAGFTFHGYAIIISALLFAAIVVTLTISSPDYDFRSQLMSELALGPAAFFAPCMLLAFLSLAFPFIALFHILYKSSGKKWHCAIPGLAAASFAGAGIFPLGAATELHVALVGVAFVASGATMYALPDCHRLFSGDRWLSRILLVLLAGSVIPGHYGMVPAGIAQRLSAAILLLWFIAIGIRLIRSASCPNLMPDPHARKNLTTRR